MKTSCAMRTCFKCAVVARFYHQRVTSLKSSCFELEEGREDRQVADRFFKIGNQNGPRPIFFIGKEEACKDRGGGEFGMTCNFNTDAKSRPELAEIPPPFLNLSPRAPSACLPASRLPDRHDTEPHAYVPIRMWGKDLKIPKMFSSHRTTTITTTPFRIDLMVPCIGMRLTSQSKTPTTIRTITT